MPDLPDLAALNVRPERRCMELWREIPHGASPGSVADIRAEERTALMPLPPAFQGFVEQGTRVAATCLIRFERNRHRVPASLANRPASLRVCGRAFWKRWTGDRARRRIEARMRWLKAFGARIAASDPDRQTAEIQIRIALVNRLSSLGSAEIAHIARGQGGKGGHTTGRNCATTPL